MHVIFRIGLAYHAESETVPSGDRFVLRSGIVHSTLYVRIKKPYRDVNKRSNLCAGLCIGAERNFTMNLVIKTPYSARVLLVLALALLACCPLAIGSAAPASRTSHAQDS